MCTLCEKTLFLEVRRSIADTASEHSCIAKELPKGLDIIKTIKNQVDVLLDSDPAHTSNAIGPAHHHIVRACSSSDVAKQELLLNILLQECTARLLKHTNEIAERKEARRADDPDLAAQCPLLGFLGTEGLLKLERT